MKTLLIGLFVGIAVMAATALILVPGGESRRAGDARPVALLPAVCEASVPAPGTAEPEMPAGSGSIAHAPVIPRVAGERADEARRAEPADTSTITILIDGRWPARSWNPGQPAYRSPLEQSPGYKKLDDPEAEATITGRRKAGPTDAQFDGGASSATELAEVIVGCINLNDYMGLRDMQITFEEFRDILWPEFPQSRPATNVKAEDAWEVLLHSSVTGARRALSEWSNQDLAFEALSFEQGWTRYANFNLYLGVRIHARTPTGSLVEIKYADGFVERGGVWKVYMYRD